MVGILLRVWLGMTFIGGVLLALGGLAELAVDEGTDEPLSESLQDVALLIHLSLNLVGNLLILLGLPALALRLARRRAGIAAASSVLLALGLAFMVAFGFFMVFIAPVLADEAPQVIDGDWTGSMATMQFGFPVFFLGTAAFAAVVLWLGTLPRAAGGVLVAAIVFSAAPLIIDGAVFGGIAFAWMGVHGILDRAAQPIQPA